MDDFQLILKRIREDDPTLTVLDINNFGIKDAEAEALAEALLNNNSLTKLDLSYNQIGPSGAKALAKALKNNNSLTKLDLWTNQIGSLGAEALAEALANNKSLTELNLSYNQIGPSGAEALANALQKNKSLTKLDLWTNEITDEGAKNIVLALEVNSTLIALNLKRNQQITKQYREKISDLTNENENVSSISKKIFSNLQVSRNLAFDDKELKLINTSPRACEKILTQLLDKFKTKETKDVIEFKGNDFVENMKGFKVGLTILLNCKDSEVFKSLNNPLTVNDLFKGLGVSKGTTNEIFSGDPGTEILKKLNKENISDLLAGSKSEPAKSPRSPLAQGQGREGSGSPQQSSP